MAKSLAVEVKISAGSLARTPGSRGRCRSACHGAFCRRACMGFRSTNPRVLVSAARKDSSTPQTGHPVLTWRAEQGPADVWGRSSK